MSNSLACENALRAAYEDTVLEISIARNDENLLNGFYAKIGDAVFEAGCCALEDFEENKHARIHTVAAPVGSGKTSFAYALMIAVTRYAETNPGAPYGCVVVVDQIKKADEVYRELRALMPGKVAIWTGDHAKNSPKGEKVKSPAALFTQDELKFYPIAIVTHQFYKGKNGYKATTLNRNGRIVSAGRALKIIDERPEQIEAYEITFAEAQKARDALLEKRPDLKGHLDALWHCMAIHACADGNTIQRATDHWTGEELSKHLGWFNELAAERVLKEHSEILGLGQLFGVGGAMAVGCAFVAPSGSLVRYVGWKRANLVWPGTMLLDATADVDGTSLICPWQQPVPVPRASYENLEIIHVPQHTKRRLKEYLKTAKNQRAYVETITKLITDHMAPGQRGVVVCKKILFDNERIPNWPEGDPRFKEHEAYTERYKWEIDGRNLCAVHWGTGIGSNAWKDADVVFLVDEFYIPRRVAIAVTQGLRDHRADEGDLGSMTTVNSRADGVDAIADGHRLRHTKQLALRGRARCYDENGVCGKQRLVVSCDLENLLRHVELLFPGAKVKLTGHEDAESTHAHKVLTALSMTDADVASVKTKQLEGTIGKPWRTVSSNVLTEDFRTEIAALGWRYATGKGRNGSSFERVVEQRQAETGDEEDTAASTVTLKEAA